ncbi:hypothetical protein PIB30_085330, partial [Stylosanthes scabra]|nr:hypothetical protein [Stylosanthes scabra]
MDARERLVVADPPAHYQSLERCHRSSTKFENTEYGTLVVLGNPEPSNQRPGAQTQRLGAQNYTQAPISTSQASSFDAKRRTPTPRRGNCPKAQEQTVRHTPRRQNQCL